MQPGHCISVVRKLWAELSPMLRGYRQRAGETAIVMALKGVFGADEAARRSNLI